MRCLSKKLSLMVKHQNFVHIEHSWNADVFHASAQTTTSSFPPRLLWGTCARSWHYRSSGHSGFLEAVTVRTYVSQVCQCHTHLCNPGLSTCSSKVFLPVVSTPADTPTLTQSLSTHSLVTSHRQELWSIAL